MINVIRKKSISDTTKSVISSTDIEALDTGTSIILMEPVKQYVNIKYDAVTISKYPRTAYIVRRARCLITD